MKKSESIEKLADALSKAQAETLLAVKDKNNPHFDFDFASLQSVWDAARPALEKHGLAVAQTGAITEDFRPYLVTTLMHTSGQWIEGELPLYTGKLTAQELGAAITYTRRYSLAAILGIAQKDDDGESLEGRNNSQNPEPQLTGKKIPLKTVQQKVAPLQSGGEPPPPACPKCGTKMLVSKFEPFDYYCPKKDPKCNGRLPRTMGAVKTAEDNDNIPEWVK